MTELDEIALENTEYIHIPRELIDGISGVFMFDEIYHFQISFELMSNLGNAIKVYVTRGQTEYRLLYAKGVTAFTAYHSFDKDQFLENISGKKVLVL